MRKSSPITQLGKRERIGKQKVTCVLTLLAVLPVWISSTGFDQSLIAANIITTAYSQQETLSSETSFLPYPRSADRTRNHREFPLLIQLKDLSPQPSAFAHRMAKAAIGGGGSF